MVDQGFALVEPLLSKTVPCRIRCGAKTVMLMPLLIGLGFTMLLSLAPGSNGKSRQQSAVQESVTTMADILRMLPRQAFPMRLDRLFGTTIRARDSSRPCNDAGGLNGRCSRPQTGWHSWQWGRTVPSPRGAEILRATSGASAVVGEQGEIPNAVAVVGSDDGQLVMLEVQNMMCGGCSGAVKRILLKQDGVESAAVNLLTGTAAIRVDAPDRAIGAAAALTAKGFDARPRDAKTANNAGASSDKGADAQERVDRATRELVLASGLVALCAGHHLGGHAGHAGMHGHAHGPFLINALGSPAVGSGLAFTALVGPGRRIFIDGLRSLYRGVPTMNSLVALGAASAFLLGIQSLASGSVQGWDLTALDEPVMLLTAILMGQNLEARARARAAADLQSLSALLPKESRLQFFSKTTVEEQDFTLGQEGVEEVLVPTAEVAVGDVVRVLPGERVPVDGILVAGQASLDESLLTGEARPVTKGLGDNLTAGTLVWDAPVLVRAQRTGLECTVNDIRRTVEDAQSREAPVQRVADKVSGPFVYTIMGLAMATFGFWLVPGASLFPGAVAAVATQAGGTSAFTVASKLAVDVLVVACPCALGLATPTAVLVGTSLAARSGVLIRGGDSLEELARVDTVVMDKTGTLTEGRMSVRGVAPATGATRGEVLGLAAALEGTTRHPLGEAIMTACSAANLEAAGAVDGAVTEAGSGVAGIVGGRTVRVGRLEWVAQISPNPAAVRATGETLAAGLAAQSSGTASSFELTGTVVFVATADAGIVGAIALADALRPDAVETIERLKQLGVTDVRLLTGDSRPAAMVAAKAAGIPEDHVVASVRPEEKAAEIGRLRASGRTVAMIGDGINDALALTEANVGIALSSGMDAATEASDVVLLGSRLGQLSEALDVAKATYSKIRQNLGWAMGYNIVGVPLAAGALLPSFGIILDPAVAGGMMAFSSIAVISNSLLLRMGRAAPATDAESFTYNPIASTSLSGSGAHASFIVFFSCSVLASIFFMLAFAGLRKYSCFHNFVTGWRAPSRWQL